MSESSYAERFLKEIAEIAAELDAAQIDAMAERIAAVRDARRAPVHPRSRRGAGHASHAVNDFRKLCALEAYAPTDNVSELTARVNDEGWETVFEAWLRTSRLGAEDGLLIFSVGGGSAEHGVSLNLVRAIEYAKRGRRHGHRRRRQARRDSRDARPTSR